MAKSALFSGESSPAAKAVLAALLLVLPALAYVFLLRAEVADEILRKRGDSARIEREIAEKKAEEKRFFSDREELLTREKKIQEYNRALPKEAAQAAFLSAVQGVATLAGVNLKGWQPMEENQEQYWVRVPMRLELSGRYHQLAKFVYELGRIDRIINVENLELYEPTQEGDEVILRARCLTTTFHLLPESEAQ